MISPRFLLTGDPALATRYVGMAKKLAVSTFQAGVISKIWNVADGVSIRVMNNVQANICKVYINAVGGVIPAYQFYGSEGTLYKTFEDPNIPGRWLPLGNWVLVKAKLRKGSLTFESKPLLSSLRESLDDPEKWVYNPNPYLSIQPGVEDILYISPVHQADGLGVKKWQSINLKTQWLVSVWAEPTPNHAIHRLSGAASFYSTSNLTDQGYDFAPTVFTGPRGVPIVPQTDWYRGACLRSVESNNYGTRLFIIMVTIKHEFYCYPVSAKGVSFELGDRKGNVDAAYVKSVLAPPLPNWVTTYDIGDTSQESSEEQLWMGQPLWVFSPEGDKAAAVMHKRDNAWADNTITSVRFTQAGEEELKEHYPGVVELMLDVQLTGPLLEDFSFSVTLSKDLYSEDTGGGYISVGYASQDFTALQGNAKYNDLLILRHRYFIGNLFYPCTYFNTSPLFDDSPSVLIAPPIAVLAEVVNNDSNDAVVMSWLASYTAEFGYYQNKVDLDEPDVIYPVFSTISDKPADDNGTRQLCFHTAINAMDIPTLTFCFGSSLTLVGKTSSSGLSFSITQQPPLFYFYKSPFCASAAYVSLYSLGVLDEERFVGHNELKAAVKGYFNLSNPIPNLGSMLELNLKAKIDSESVVVPLEPPDAKCWDLFKMPLYRSVVQEEWGFDLQTMYANITLITGTGNGNQTKEVVFASATNYHSNGLVEYQYGPNPLAAHYSVVNDAYMVWIPRIFTHFDGIAYERPGLRWTAKELLIGSNPPDYLWHGVNQNPSEYILENGDSSYTGYPLGAILHARFTDIVTHPLNNVYANINAEPNGSYAIFFGPFVAPTSTVKTHNNLNNPLPNFSAFTLEHNFMDVIRIRVPKGSDYIEGKTSHVTEMHKAYKINLTENDYIFEFVVDGDKLKIKNNAFIPDDAEYTEVGNVYDNNYGYLPDTLGYNKTGQVGGSIFLSPMAVGWSRTFYGNGVDYSQFQTLPAFTILDFPYFVISHPTPRIEGLFTQLPMKET